MNKFYQFYVDLELNAKARQLNPPPCLQTLEKLINKGANVNAHINGYTILMDACRKERSDIVRLLLKYKADPNLIYKTGNTALSYACNRGNVHIAKLLLDNGADPNIVYWDGSTDLIECCRFGYLYIVRELLQHGADINLLNNRGESALYVASYFGFNEIVTELSQRDAEIRKGTLSEGEANPLEATPLPQEDTSLLQK